MSLDTSTRWEIARLLARGGQPLSASIRAEFEPLLGRDLSDVRVHVRPDLVRRLDARAFTFGSALVFDSDAYHPESPAGRRLIAHELAHCVQQSLAGPRSDGPTDLGTPDDPLEKEADAAAEHLLAGEPVLNLRADRSGHVRRVVRPVPGSANLTVLDVPILSPPSVTPGGIGKVGFRCTPIWAAGTVALQGTAPGDSPAGWTLGFLQVEYVETCWVHYRGERNDHGSLLLQRGRPPARPARACRDSVAPAAAVWYNPAANGTTQSFGEPLSTTFNDRPGDHCQLVEPNTLTGQPNFLREMQLSMMFCCVLSLRDPAANWHHLQHFYWNIRWQHVFTCTDYADPLAIASWTVSARTQAANVGRVHGGAPRDARFASLLTSLPPAPAAPVETCNAVAVSAYTQVAPGMPGRREEASWHNFDVTR